MSLTATRTAPPRPHAPATAPPAPTTHAAPTATAQPERLASLDAYRGFVMLAMAAAGLNIPRVAHTLAENARAAGLDSYPGQRVWEFLAYQTDHVGWVGCGF